jgi:hypothetical protein
MAGVVTPVTTPDAYANDEDLAIFWKPITSDEDKARANSLLKLASNRLRTISTRQGHGDMDTLVNDDPAYFVTVQWVIMEATKRAMLTPTDQPPVDTFSQTAGPYSENYKYTNPSGDLWFKKSELNDLGLYGNQRLGNVASTTADIYGS